MTTPVVASLRLRRWVRGGRRYDGITRTPSIDAMMTILTISKKKSERWTRRIRLYEELLKEGRMEMELIDVDAAKKGQQKMVVTTQLAKAEHDIRTWTAKLDYLKQDLDNIQPLIQVLQEGIDMTPEEGGQ